MKSEAHIENIRHQVRRVLRARLPHASSNYTAVSLVPSSAPATCTAMIAKANEVAMRCVAPRIIRAGNIES